MKYTDLCALLDAPYLSEHNGQLCHRAAAAIREGRNE